MAPCIQPHRPSDPSRVGLNDPSVWNSRREESLHLDIRTAPSTALVREPHWTYCVVQRVMQDCVLGCSPSFLIDPLSRRLGCGSGDSKSQSLANCCETTPPLMMVAKLFAGRSNEAFHSPNIPATPSSPTSSPSTTRGASSTSMKRACTGGALRFGVSRAILPAS